MITPFKTPSSSVNEKAVISISNYFHIQFHIYDLGLPAAKLLSYPIANTELFKNYWLLSPLCALNKENPMKRIIVHSTGSKCFNLRRSYKACTECYLSRLRTPFSVSMYIWRFFNNCWIHMNIVRLKHRNWHVLPTYDTVLTLHCTRIPAEMNKQTCHPENHISVCV